MISSYVASLSMPSCKRYSRTSSINAIVHMVIFTFGPRFPGITQRRALRTMCLPHMHILGHPLSPTHEEVPTASSAFPPQASIGTLKANIGDVLRGVETLRQRIQEMAEQRRRYPAPRSGMQENRPCADGEPISHQCGVVARKKIGCGDAGVESHPNSVDGRRSPPGRCRSARRSRLCIPSRRSSRLGPAQRRGT
jgi:hypothetical protein